MDAENALPLPGALIKVENSKRYTYSDKDGNYEFLNMPVGKYTIYTEYLGYLSSYTAVEVAKGKSTVANFEINPGLQELTEVVIIGNSLKGQAKALNQQKNNNNISNIISADQVGRFPDANIGDALKRVSGITMQNDQGEARDIIIRGLAPALNSVTLNGDRIPSAEGDNRNVQMDLIPSDMISTIEVNKTLTSDMDADAIGGSVNLITRATPNKRRIAGTIAGGYIPIREKGSHNTSLLYGNRFADNKWGIILSGTWQSQNFGADNIEALWNQKDKKSYVSQMDIRKYDVQRIRRSFSFNTDYQFNENNRIDFSAMYNWRDDRENRYRVRYKSIKPKDGDVYTTEIRRETKGGINNNRNKNTRLEDQRVLNLSLKGEHLLSPKLDMEWKVTYSKASEDRPNERYIDFREKKVTVREILSDLKKPFIQTEKEDNAENYALRKISENHNYTQEDELGAKMDFRTPMSVIDGEKGRLRFGVKTRLKNKMRDNIYYEYSPIEKYRSLNETPHISINGKGFYPGEQYIPGNFINREFLGNLDLNNKDLFTKKLVPAEYLAANYSAKEQIYAGYLRWDQDLNDKTKIVAGIRLEQTHIDYTGNYVINENDLKQEINTSNNYLNLLPSFSIKHNINKDFILRAAITTALARPDYYKLAPYVSAIADENEIKAGNPKLKATYATNFDLMAENYFKNIGIISAGVYYKILDNFIYTYQENKFSQNKFSEAFPQLPNPITGSDTWKFKQARNGEKVYVYGFEFAFQRQLDFLPSDFLKHFGIYTNYTYTGSKAKGITNDEGEKRSDLALPKTAPHMLNASLSWENKKISARLSANYTSAYLDQVGGNDFEDSYYDRQFFLDFNFSYKFKKHFEIFAEASNLTNQPLRYYQGTVDYLQQLEYYGARYNMGLKFDF